MDLRYFIAGAWEDHHAVSVYNKKLAYLNSLRHELENTEYNNRRPDATGFFGGGGTRPFTSTHELKAKILALELELMEEQLRLNKIGTGVRQ